MSLYSGLANGFQGHPAGIQQQPRLLVHSRPLLPFLGGCSVHPQPPPPPLWARIAVLMCPLPLLALCGQFPPQCWMLEATQVRSSSSARGCHGHHTPPNFCTTGATLANPPQGRGNRASGWGGRDRGKKRSGRSWQLPVESLVGTGAYGPVVLAFPAPLPSTPGRECSTVLPWLTQSGVHCWHGEELDTELLSCRGLFAPAALLIIACPAPWGYQAVPAGLELGLEAQHPLAPRTPRSS